MSTQRRDAGKPRLMRLLVACSAAVLLASTFPITAANAAPTATAVVVASPTGNGAKCTTKSPCSLPKAQEIARQKAADASEDVTVVLNSGVYRLTEPLTFTAADSGRGTHRVTYTGAAGTRPVISGERAASRWELFDSKAGIYRSKVGTASFRDVYVDGHPAVRARSAGAPEGMTQTATGYDLSDSEMSSWGNKSDIEVVAHIYWKELRCPVADITGAAMTMQQPCWKNANLHTGLGMQNVAWVENAYELLDQGGEWYHDRTTGYLYYKPVAGQKMKSTEVTIPVAEQLLVAEGTADAPVRNLTFKGLEFRGTTWNAPSTEEGYAPAQSGFRLLGENTDWASARTSWHQTPGALSFRYASGVAFTGNIVQLIGAAGLNLETGVQNATVAGNVFSDIGSTAIQLGGITEADHHPSTVSQRTQGLDVLSNYIQRAGVHYRDGVGIWAGYIANSRIENNQLQHLPYSGISFGWGWGLFDEGGNPNYAPDNGQVPVYDSPSNNANNSVRHNRILDYMLELADGAGIYTLGNGGGTQITDNYISDLKNPNYFAIYLDEASAEYRVQRNVSCRTSENWLNVHASFHNVLTYNFADVAGVKTPGTEPGALDLGENSTGFDCSSLPASLITASGPTAAWANSVPSSWRAQFAEEAPEDSVAPAAVTEVHVEETTASRAVLSWTAATDNEGVTGYEIAVNGSTSYATPGERITISRLTPGAKVDVSIRARDAAANLSKATAVTFTTPEADEVDTVPPTDPSNLTVAGTGASTIVIDWSASEDLHGVEKYLVSVDGTQALETTATSAAVTGLAAGTAHDVTVVAQDKAGNASGAASTSGTTAAPAPLPEELDIPGLALWLDRSTVETSDGDRVAVWADSSGAGNDAFQTAGNARPRMDAAGDGDRGALSFNGASWLLETNEPVTTNTQYTVLVASTVDSNAWGPFYNGDSSRDGYGFYKLQSSLFGTIHGGVGFQTYGPVEGVGQVRVQALVGSAGQEQFFVDGVESGQATSTSPIAPSRSTLIGAVDRFAPFAGQIAEVVVFDRALTADELETVTAFMTARHS